MTDQIIVTVIEQNSTKVLSAHPGDSLKELLRRNGISVSMPCGGEGRCGKCKVVIRGEGEKLLCRTEVYRDCTVEIPAIHQSEDDILAEKAADSSFAGEYKGRLGVAVDLGTTTIVAALVGDGEVKTVSGVNHQRRFGSDVISRIQAAEDPDSEAELRRCVHRDIMKLIEELVPKERFEDLEVVTIAGNTTMLHLLTGKDVSGLGTYPYTPVSLDFEEFEGGSDMLRLIPGAWDRIRIIIMPGISAFVGADIVSGLYYLTEKLLKGREALFMDLGTNGEMAYISGDSLKVTSTAAGPVFEGGQISCGTASVPGAVCHVSLSGTEPLKVQSSTIGDKPAIGLCGTGALELVSELVRCGIVDETGLLEDEYFETGFPFTNDGMLRFTQQDIREIQMGKAAIAAGIRALTETSDPEVIYVAGGFGSASDPSKLWNLNIFPDTFDGKIVVAGNTALQGAMLFTSAVLAGRGAEEQARSRVQSIVDRAQLIELAGQDDFGEEYINSMNF